MGRSAADVRERLFGLPWPLTMAQSHTRTATVLVDEFDAGYFPSCRSPTRIIARKMIGLVLTQGTKIVNLRRDSVRRS